MGTISPMLPIDFSTPRTESSSKSTPPFSVVCNSQYPRKVKLPSTSQSLNCACSSRFEFSRLPFEFRMFSAISVARPRILGHPSTANSMYSKVTFSNDRNFSISSLSAGLSNSKCRYDSNTPLNPLASNGDEIPCSTPLESRFAKKTGWTEKCFLNPI